MTDEETSRKGNTKGRSKKNKSRKGKSQSPPSTKRYDTRSTTSSSTRQNPSKHEKVVLLKRNHGSPPRESSSGSARVPTPLMETKPNGNLFGQSSKQPQSAALPKKQNLKANKDCEPQSSNGANKSPPPLMQVNTNRQEFWPKTDESANVTDRQAEANRRQRDKYYFSENPGTAVSANTFQTSVQYKMGNFPIDRNINIPIENKFTLLIVPTAGRCQSLHISVKSQKRDDTVTAGALLRLSADEKTVRDACVETINNFVAVAAKGTLDRFPFSNSSDEYLKECHIRRLEDRLDAFPEAIYYCEKCDYHINTITHAKNHLEGSTHFEDVEKQAQRVNLLKKIPKPTDAHLKAVNQVLSKTLDEYEEIMKNRKETSSSILSYLKNQLFPSINCENVVLKPFGSSNYDVVLPDSDYNVAMSLDISEGTQMFKFMEKVRKQIEDDGHPADHSMDIGTSSMILFTYEGIRVRLCWLTGFNCLRQPNFTQLMQAYTSLRPEVVKFLQLIRLWAYKAGLDSKNKSRIGLPRYGFDIMAIHYLQQEGILPVLHHLYEEEVEEKEKDKQKDPQENKEEPLHVEDAVSNQPEQARQRRLRLMSRYQKDVEKVRSMFDLTKEWNLAKLWIGFFRYYVERHRDVVVQMTQKEPMSRDCNRWNKKILHVVDPFRSDNVLAIPKVSTWQPFYFNCLLVTYISFAIPRTENGPVVEVTFFQSKSKRKLKEQPSKRFAEDELAVDEEELLRQEEMRERLTFDGIKLCFLNPEDVEIDEHFNQMYGRHTMQRVRRRYTLEMNEDQLSSIDMADRFLLTSRNRKKLGKLMRTSRRANEENKLDLTREADLEVAAVTKEITEKLFICNVDSAQEIEEVTPQGGSSGIPNLYTLASPVPNSVPSEQKKEETLMEQTEDPVVLRKATTTSRSTATFVKHSIITEAARLAEGQVCIEEFHIRETVNREQIIEKTKTLDAADFRFQFTAELFCGGYEMELKCTYCDGSHCVEQCPLMEIPPIEKFAPRTAEELKDIDDIIDNYFEENKIQEGRLKLLRKKVDELEKFLKKSYQEDISLTIFGSVMTGLSVNCSDIDICLRFGSGDEPPKDRTPKDVIQKMEEVLRRSHLAKRVQAIVTAKVPIVKFQIKLDNNDMVDVDVSYYNILAIYNTSLLKEYTYWTPDNRFAKLALFIKAWAKRCDIGDASRGSLSSYAHIVLLVSYLQQCDPPVLPRLQEDFRSGTTERRMVENWDTSFVQAEKQLFEGWQKNKETCAQLLIGYFDYYSRFDFRNFVVQCRRETNLSKIEKDWQRPLCVEDPFDLNHNLSSGITKKMFVFVMKVFIASRAVFMSAIPKTSRGPNFLSDFKEQLFCMCSQGSAPADRQCHACHKIGHFVDQCPRRNQGKDSRRRYGSNSTTSSYRSNGNDNDGQPDRLQFHKRTYHRRSHR
ncbi:unnamed protein product [Caenorhabditis sp. 36 PRJEB53466]|nr:unnamed protein product [Caenorhabditis sp. 36 PRJEB53466]